MSLNAPTLDGQTVSLPVPRYITVVDVWDTSCEPCQRIMPALERLAERDAARVKVIGVALDDNPGLVTQKLKERGITYPNVVDADWQLRGWLRVDKIPSTVVFDAHGNIRWFHTGGDDVDLGRLSDAVDSLVREG
jgi:thiol-disulfide isomerase/thioredoxin